MNRSILDDVHGRQIFWLAHGQRVFGELDEEVAIILFFAFSIDRGPLFCKVKRSSLSSN